MKIETKFDMEQEVYFIHELHNTIHKGIIAGFTMFAEFKTPLWEVKDQTRFGYINTNEENLFATKEEAEAKLKEME